MALPGVDQAVAAAVRELGRVFGEKRVLCALGSLVQGAADTKQRVDSGVDSVLSLANLPSRSEVERIARKVEATQRSVANLSRRIDSIDKSLKALVDRQARPADAGSADSRSADAGATE